jgi:geranylgeranyl pyrophosphate synthase
MKNTTETWLSVIKSKGNKINEVTKEDLLDDPALVSIREPLQFLSDNWSDPLRPALTALGCEAVGGKSEDTEQTAIALCLINLSFYLWDDLIDDAKKRVFKQTFYGKYGADATLLMSEIASSKGFVSLNKQVVKESKRSQIFAELWKLSAGILTTEIISTQERKRLYHSSQKLWKITKENQSNLATCLRVGGIIGNGSKQEIRCLGNYGKALGIIIDLRNDLRVTANLTLELAQKIRTGALPYSLLWAKEHSETTASLLMNAKQNNELFPEQIENIVKSTLETGILERIDRITDKLVKKAVAELEGFQQNDATVMLVSFVKAQPQFLSEIFEF